MTASQRVKQVFQSTPPHGGRRVGHEPVERWLRFQSTPPHGGRRHRLPCSHFVRDGFNPRPRTEGDFGYHGIRHMVAVFQSTPPHGGRPVRDLSLPKFREFQSTPPHGGRPFFQIKRWRCGCVSIHAPARRATAATMIASAFSSGFNPRPRTEGDQDLRFRPVRRIRFQSTPPHGGRRWLAKCFSSSALFQSTPPHGGRPFWFPDRSCRPGFNPRPRTEGDSCRAPRNPRNSSFNPRPRTEGDPGRRGKVHDRLVSIHAPARRATARDVCVFRRRSVSIHAPARRATRRVESSTSPTWTFQSTPPHGGRPAVTSPSELPAAFQSTPPHGGRPTTDQTVPSASVFQSTPPHGGRPVADVGGGGGAGVSIHAPARRATRLSA